MLLLQVELMSYSKSLLKASSIVAEFMIAHSRFINSVRARLV